MKILNRDYEINVNEVKGFEKLREEQTSNIDKCKLIRCTVVLDETQYTVNKEGCPEMTQASQKEYDELVFSLRQRFLQNEISILDEGYGVDEDELEWHITGCVINNEDKISILGIIEIDTCVRTEDPDE